MMEHKSNVSFVYTESKGYRGTDHLHIPVPPLPVKLLLMSISDIRMIHASFYSITTPLLNAFSHTFSILLGKTIHDPRIVLMVVEDVVHHHHDGMLGGGWFRKH